MIEFLKSDMFNIINAGALVIMLTLLLAIYFKFKKLNKSYNIFMKKIGKSENIDETLKRYIKKVEEVEGKNEETMTYCSRLDKEMRACIQKVGIVRYNAFKDTGSDLSFTLALLDDNDDGVVLNGIYSREMSNIYAKKITKGQAESKLSDEEKEAIYMAINQSKEFKIRE